jgi:tRNA-modifying protein YgfZ
MNHSTQPIPPTLLPFLGVLRVTGPDALGFLQGQLTNDVRLLLDGRTQLAALNTPQGRVVALMRLRQFDDVVHALLPTELLEPVSTLLRRYVLRSKVQVHIAADLQVGWLDGRALPATDAVVFDYARRRQVVAATADAWRAIAGAAPMKARPRAEDEWLAQDIADGLPQVFAATSGAFVAQMLNLDLLDAISFSKGCYTGQEIVARTQHLGRIKRRLLRYRLPPGPVPAPLAALYSDTTKVAEVVISAGLNDGVHLLAVTSLEARGTALHTEDGRQAEPVDLAYPFTARD